jgi:hypothetical protein
VEIDDEELYYVPDNVLEKAGAARYHILPKKLRLLYQK